MQPLDETQSLLQRWHEGDQAAFDALIERSLPWIRARLERRVGDLLRTKAEVDDFVQEALVELLRYGPRFVMSNGQQFRGLLAKMIENVIRDQHDRFTAQRRQVHREQPIPRDTLLNLDPPARDVTRPSSHAHRHEGQAWVRIAIELLAPEHREIILMRQWEGQSFGAIAGHLGIAENAARMRFHRSVQTLGELVKKLQTEGAPGVDTP